MTGMDELRKAGVTGAEFAETIKRNAQALAEAWNFLGAATGRTEPPMVDHKGGISWHEAPIPGRWHRCRAQTQGSVDGAVWTERCACGATRRSPGLLGSRGPWIERNSRRRVR